MISANFPEDTQAIASWLEELTERNVAPSTQSAYERELRRVLWYQTTQGAIALVGWSPDQAHAYLQFLWGRAAEFRCPVSARPGDPDWTPFRGPLSDKSRLDALRIMHVMFEHWRMYEVCERNPFKVFLPSEQNRGGRREDSRYITRYSATSQLSAEPRAQADQPDDLIALALDAMECQPRVTARDFLRHYRNRFLLLLLGRTPIWITDLVQAEMSHVHLDAPAKLMIDSRPPEILGALSGRGFVGDDPAPRPECAAWIHLPDDVVDAFLVYRRAFHLPANPASDERLGLVLSLMTDRQAGQGGTTANRRWWGRYWRDIRTRQGIWKIVSEVFQDAARHHREQGRVKLAARLDAVTPRTLKRARACRE